MLDSISDRGGEWHYMQAIVFYKRDWLIEARTQLEMALQDDPSNAKYRNSLEKLKMAIQNPDKGAANFAGNGGAYNAGINGGAGESLDQPSQAEQMSNCLSSCCCAYCLTDCLCTSMRCCF